MNLNVGLGAVDHGLDDRTAVRVAVWNSGKVHVRESCRRGPAKSARGKDCRSVDRAPRVGSHVIKERSLVRGDVHLSRSPEEFVRDVVVAVGTSTEVPVVAGGVDDGSCHGCGVGYTGCGEALSCKVCVVRLPETSTLCSSGDHVESTRGGRSVELTSCGIGVGECGKRCPLVVVHLVVDQAGHVDV